MGLPAKIEKVQTLRDLLTAQAQALQEAAPKHLTVDRLIRVACAAVSRQPLLLDCTTPSMLSAIMQSVQLGLEPGSALGHAYLVPFKNKNGTREVTLILGYRGLIDLARRSGHITSIESRVVRESDQFRLEYGLHPVLQHIPRLNGDAGKLIAVYAVARFTGSDDLQFEVMSKAQVDAIRAQSKSKDDGPWITDYDEMARKTVVKRLCKSLPLSVDFAEAVEDDSAREFGTPFNLPPEGEVRTEQPVSRTETLRQKVAGKVQPPAEIEPEPEAEQPPGPAEGTPEWNAALDADIAAEQAAQEGAPAPEATPSPVSASTAPTAPRRERKSRAW